MADRPICKGISKTTACIMPRLSTVSRRHPEGTERLQSYPPSPPSPFPAETIRSRRPRRTARHQSAATRNLKLHGKYFKEITVGNKKRRSRIMLVRLLRLCRKARDLTSASVPLIRAIATRLPVTAISLVTNRLPASNFPYLREIEIASLGLG